MAGEPRPGDTEWMADRDRAAVHVELLIGDAELLLAVDRLRRKGLVELPQVDVVDLQPMAGEQLGYREHGADAHLVGLAAGHRQAAKGTQRLQTAALGLPSFDHHAGRGAIRELGGVAGSDKLARTHDGLELGQRLVGRAAPVAGIGIDRDLALGHRLGFLVRHAHRGRARDDLVAVAAGDLSVFGLALALYREAVLRLAADAVARGHDVRSFDHREIHRRLVLNDPGIRAGAAVFARADLRDALDATGDHRRRAFDDDA